MNAHDISLQDGERLRCRPLQEQDEEALYKYLNHALSAESRSRFGPHSFDRAGVATVCQNLHNDVVFFVATQGKGDIAAYFLMKKGLIEADRVRLAGKGFYFDAETAYTFAPSVADAYQKKGLGPKMYAPIEASLKDSGAKTIILWGGVQASNQRAVRYYEKLGFIKVNEFWHNDMNNYDMIKHLN